MKRIPLNPETEALARRISLVQAARRLADPVRFIAYVMTCATIDDLCVVRRYVSDEDFREALNKAPPGIIDPCSWSYWNMRFGRYPPQAMPTRKLD